MPSIPLMQLPKSRSAEEFEKMCKDILTNEYGIRFKRYGRNGQKQNGIDIYAEQVGGGYIVAQCKNYFSLNSANDFTKQINKDVKNAEKIPFQINHFIAMTALDTDLNIQNYIENIDGKIHIEVWFWEDIQERVCSNDNLFKKYYPDFFIDTGIPVMEINQIISNLNILISSAQSFNEHKDYRVAYHENNNIILYNQCVAMFNAALNINAFKDKWYMQLQEKKILGMIEEIVKSIPDFHDATQDWTCSTMIYTLTNYLRDYSSDEFTESFIKKCNKIIKKITKLYLP